MRKIIFSEIESKLIISSYENGKSSEVIAEEFKVSPQTITRFLKSSKIKLKKSGFFQRKYFFAEDYFETINSENKAYWLGFIAADGYVGLNGLSISLSQDDETHLALFKKEIGLKSETVLKKSIHNKIWKGRFISRADAFSRKMSADLFKFFDTNKTFSLDFVKITRQIPAELIKHFIRGYFDGDGCWNCSGRYSQRFIFTCASEKNFLENLQKFLKDQADLPINNLLIRANSKAKSLAYTGKQSCIKFYHYIYSDATVFLKRKKDKAFSFLF